jgi:DNA-3-methyladenine glycosylase II
MRRALNHLKKSDPVLADIIARVGPCKMAFRMPVFEMLVRAIVFQQLSTKSATAIYNRLLEAAGGTITAQSIQALSIGELRRAGLSSQKTNYIRDLADHTNEGTLDFAALPAMSDEEVITALTQVKGIGEWTAQMFLMFSLRRPNILPTGDLGIRMAIRKAYKKRYKTKDGLPSPKHIHKLAKPWHPYCSVASWYLWRSLEGTADI